MWEQANKGVLFSHNATLFPGVKNCRRPLFIGCVKQRSKRPADEAFASGMTGLGGRDGFTKDGADLGSEG